jgi:alkylation response protein AidB-like acyl-CoA dehydrogenase|tara:strand:- start:5832 stop:6980 length:1149 start_codon:yes stop_codon:yes gene_type:complete
MQYELSEDNRRIKEMVRRIALEQVAPRAAEIDAKAEYPQDMFDLLRELGLFTLPFEEKYGGMNSILSACIAIEEFGRICYNTAYLLVVQWVPFGAILAGGSEDQKEKYLPGLADGSIRGAFSTTESQSGSDVGGILTRATPVKGGYQISGNKIWCTNSSVADFVVVAARLDGMEGKRAINFFIVDRGSKGFSVGAPENKMGARGVPSCPLYFDDVFVNQDAMLGQPGEGFRIVMEAFNISRPIIGARGVGLSQGAFDHALAFVKERRAFGEQIVDFQGVRWMLADMHVQTEAARNLVYKAAVSADLGITGKALAIEAAVAKCHASDTAMRVATDAVQLFGASGISSDYPINRYFRDAKVLQIVEGTQQIQRNIISRYLVDGT